MISPQEQTNWRGDRRILTAIPDDGFSGHADSIDAYASPARGFPPLPCRGAQFVAGAAVLDLRLALAPLATPVVPLLPHQERPAHVGGVASPSRSGVGPTSLR